MSDIQNKRYYWLKLQEDFFKRHDIRIVEEMPNGKDYIIFYLKLMCESVSHEGLLRFNEAIPYNSEMLSVITNTNIDIVNNAIKVFKELKMIEVLDDGTLYMQQVEKLIGSETKDAERKRKYRESLKWDIVPQLSQKRPQDIEIDIDIEKDIDIDIDIDVKKKKPTKHKYGEYKHVLLTDEQYKKLVSEYDEDTISEYIKKIDEYCQQYGKKYSDYNLTIRKWMKKDGGVFKKERIVYEDGEDPYNPKY